MMLLSWLRNLIFFILLVVFCLSTEFFHYWISPLPLAYGLLLLPWLLLLEQVFPGFFRSFFRSFLLAYLFGLLVLLPVIIHLQPYILVLLEQDIVYPAYYILWYKLHFHFRLQDLPLLIRQAFREWMEEAVLPRWSLWYRQWSEEMTKLDEFLWEYWWPKFIEFLYYYASFPSIFILIPSFLFFILLFTLFLLILSRSTMAQRYLEGFSYLSGLVLGFFFGIFHQLLHFSRNILFFINRHLYSSPSYTGLIINRFPRLYAWLMRMSYSKSFSKKRRALQSRRHYLLFVWFFFSFFFRAIFLIPFLLCKSLLLSLYWSSNGAFASSFSFLLYFLFLPLHRLYYYFLVPLKQALSVRFFRYYIILRRFLYYLSVNDYTSYFHSLFEEKNTAAVEQRTNYDNYELAWLLDRAAPFSIPTWRPSILRFFSKIIALSPNLRLIALPALLLLWLSWFVSLLLKTLLLLLVLPVVFLFQSVQYLFLSSGFLRLYFFTFIKYVQTLSFLLNPAWSTLVRPFWGLFIGFSFTLVDLLSHLFLYLPFLLYNFLWLSLQILAYLPLGVFYILRFCLAFFVRKLTIFALLVFFLFFCHPLLCSFSECLETLLPGPLSLIFYGEPWQWSSLRGHLLFSDHRLLFGSFFYENWLVHAQNSKMLWRRLFYHYIWGARATVNPYQQWALWEKYFRMRLRRAGFAPQRYIKEVLCLYGEGLHFRAPAHSLSKRVLLYKLTQFPLAQAGAFDSIWIYQRTYHLMYLTTLFVEQPYALLTYYSQQSLQWFRKSFFALCAYPKVGILFRFYGTYYAILGSSLFHSIEFLGAFLPLLSSLAVSFYLGLSLLFSFFFECGTSLSSYLLGVTQTYSKELTFGSGKAYLLFLLTLWSRQLKEETWFASVLILLTPRAFVHYLLGLKSMLEFPFTVPGVITPLWYYLFFLFSLEQLTDTLSIYWQIPKRAWGDHGLWSDSYALGYELRNANIFLRKMYLSRQSLFNPEFSFDFDLGTLLTSLCLESSFVVSAYGAEIQPGYPRWKRAMAILLDGELLTLRETLRNPKFYAPWARHLGYLSPYAPNSSPFPGYWSKVFSDYRLFSWTCLSPLFYFIFLLFFVSFSSSFRELFFSKLVEGGGNQYWSDFVHDKDLRWVEKLLIPPFAVSSEMRTSNLAWFVKDLPWSKLLFRDFTRLREASWKFPEFRSADIKKTLPGLWKPFSEALSSSPKVRVYRRFWQRKLWPKGYSWPYNKVMFTRNAYRYRFFDWKLLNMYRQIHEVYFVQPRRLDEFLRIAHFFDDLNLPAALTSVYYAMEDEEIRAEYVFRQRYVNQRLKFIDSTKSYFQWLDGRLFDHRLGGFFLHKEGLQGHWISHPASHLLQSRVAKILRFRLTPMLFARFLQKRRYYFTVLEDTKLYPLLLFWFFIFPLIVFVQGLLTFHSWRWDWSPKKARFTGAEYWLLWTQIFLHFDTFYEMFYYLWTYVAFDANPVRPGSMKALDDPSRWLRSSTREEFYIGSLMRRWCFEEGLFFWNFSPHRKGYFTFGVLSEQRFVKWLITFLQLFLFFFLLLRFTKQKPRFFVLRKGLGSGLNLSWVTLVQQLHYKQLKLQLKKGLVWFWLKA